MENSIKELLSYSCDNLKSKDYNPRHPKTNLWKDMTPQSRYPLELVVALHLIRHLVDRDHLTRTEELLLIDDLLEQIETLLEHCPEEQIVLGRYITGYLDPKDIRDTYAHAHSGNVIACLIFSDAIQECSHDENQEHLQIHLQEVFQDGRAQDSEHHHENPSSSEISCQMADALWEFIKSITHIKIMDLKEISHLYRHHMETLLHQQAKPLTLPSLSKKSKLEAEQTALYLAYDLLYERHFLKLMDTTDHTIYYTSR